MTVRVGRELAVERNGWQVGCRRSEIEGKMRLKITSSQKWSYRTNQLMVCMKKFEKYTTNWQTVSKLEDIQYCKQGKEKFSWGGGTRRKHISRLNTISSGENSTLIHPPYEMQPITIWRETQMIEPIIKKESEHVERIGKKFCLLRNRQRKYSCINRKNLIELGW